MKESDESMDDHKIIDLNSIEPGSDEEAEVVRQMNIEVQKRLEDDKPDKLLIRMKHISHLDLDGFGATILSEILMKFYPDNSTFLETKNILPNKLAQELKDTFDHIDDYDIVVITDLAINQTVLDMIREHPQGKKVHVFDHHITDVDHLEENMVVTEDSPIHPGHLTCATELYYDFIRNDKIYTVIHNPSILRAIRYFVDCVRVYDTFEFWSTRNDPELEQDMTYLDAPRLNTLFHIMDRDEFKEYIFKYVYSDNWERLTISTHAYPWVSKILELENNKNMKYVESAIRRIVKTPLNALVFRGSTIHKLDYNTGVIYAERSSPLIANESLERNPDLDLCAVVSNNQVSLYSNKESVNVCEIAKIFGGGGHASAAGFTIPYISASVFNMDHFARILECAGNLIPGTIVFEDLDVTDTN